MEDDIFWLVLKLEISYYRVRLYLEGFWVFFLKILFLHGEIFEFS